MSHGHESGGEYIVVEKAREAAKEMVKVSYQAIGIFMFGLLELLRVGNSQMMPESGGHGHH